MINGGGWKAKYKKLSFELTESISAATPKLKNWQDALNKSFSKGKRKSTVGREENAKKVRKERRENATSVSADQMAVMEEDATLLLNLRG